MTFAIRPLLAGACAAIAAGFAAPASAAPGAWVGDCNDYAAPPLIVEPWEQNSRTFYNGQVRVAVSDTDGEPACCSSWLLVIFPDKDDELGGRLCMMLGSDEGMGFAGVDVKAIRSSYDAAAGLTLSVPVHRLKEDGSGTSVDTVDLLLDLRTSKLTVKP